jgi:hypothetical protein
VDWGAAVLLGFLDSSARFLLRFAPSLLLPTWIFGFSAAATSFAFSCNFRCPDLIPRARPTLDLSNCIFSLSIPLKVLAWLCPLIFLILRLVTAAVYHRLVYIATGILISRLACFLASRTYALVSGVLVHVGFVLVSPDQKLKVFQVLVTFLWWFLRHTHKVFGEMFMRMWEARRSDFDHGCVAYDSCLHQVVFPLW